MKAFLIAIGVVFAAAGAMADCTAVSVPCQRILGDGDDAHRVVIAVAGEGYTAQQQAQFNDDVDFILTRGLFARDFFAEHKASFELYRLNIASQVSGIGSTAERNTAFGLTYNGSRDKCWFTKSLTTDDRVIQATAGLSPDLTIVIAKTADNDIGGVGCAYSHYVVVTRAASWSVAAHELGHGIGGLFDEYVMTAAAPPTTVNFANCSTNRDRTQIAWAGKITARDVPTPENPDDLTTIGAYPGCEGFAIGIFRPSQRCRMGTTHFARFCSVCLDAMKAAVAAREAGEPLPVPPGDPAPVPLLHVVVRLSKSAAAPLTILWRDHSASRRTAAVQPYTVRALFDGKNVDESPIVIEPFTSRGYSGLAHAVVSADSMIADLYLPITDVQLQEKGIELQLWRALSLTQDTDANRMMTTENTQRPAVKWKGKQMRSWGAAAFKKAYLDYQPSRK